MPESAPLINPAILFVASAVFLILAVNSLFWWGWLPGGTFCWGVWRISLVWPLATRAGYLTAVAVGGVLGYRHIFGQWAW